MATITTSLGIGSGIDIKGTVDQLTAAEGKPQLDAIAAKTSVSQAKLSGLGTLKGALSSFQNAVKALNQSTSFEAQQITSSDEKILKVTTVPGTNASSHTVKVNSLAKPQKSVSTAEFKSTDVVSEGTLVFKDNTGTSKFSVTVKQGENDTLAGLRDAINKATGNTSVVASIVNVDAKTGGGTISKLVLTSRTPGLNNTFTVDASLGDTRFNLNPIETPYNFSTTDATDANVIIDAQATAAIPQRSVSGIEFGENDVVAPGAITFKDAKGNEKFSVNISTGSNDKLFEVMDAINGAEGNDSVVASVINVNSKTNPGTIVSKLVFSAKQPGIEHKFSIDASKGDTRLNLDDSPIDAQRSISNVEFSSPDDVIAAGKISFKNAAGVAQFSIDVTAEKTITTTTTGSLNEEGNPITTIVTSTGEVDADGNLITTTTVKDGAENTDDVPVVKTEVVKGSNNTLAALRDAINFSPENKLVSASIITVDSTENPGTQVSKLVLTAQKPGIDNRFTIDATAGDTKFNFDPATAADSFATTMTTATYDTTPASDAGEGGMSITRSSNSISDAVPGVTLTLIDKGTANIDTHADQSGISKPITGFVEAYNKLNETLKQLTVFVKAGDPGNGPLLGENTVQSIATQFKKIVNDKVTTATGDYHSLTQLGITFDKKGVMILDNAILDKAVAADLTSVGNIFASKEGVASRLAANITQYLDAKGALSTQQDTINKQLKTFEVEKAAVQKRLEATQKSLQQQFIAMDTAVSQFKNTGSFLTQALAPKTNSN